MVPTNGQGSTSGRLHESTQRVPEVEGALLTALLDQHAFGIGVCDSEGVLSLLNAEMARILGEKFQPTVHHTWARRYHLHDEHGAPLASRRDPLARALRGEEVVGEVISVQRAGRPVCYIRCNALQLRGGHGEILGAAVFATDVTAQLAEQRRLDDLRDRLITTVNHEVRTPLAVTNAHLELLEDETMPEAAEWSLAAMRRASARLTEVVQTISELTDESTTCALVSSSAG